MYDKHQIYSYILNFADQRASKCEVHPFPSGATMIDLWIGDRLVVVQIENKKAGFSVIDQIDVEFSSLPDESYDDFEEFKLIFEKVCLDPDGGTKK